MLFEPRRLYSFNEREVLTDGKDIRKSDEPGLAFFEVLHRYVSKELTKTTGNSVRITQETRQNLHGCNAPTN